MRKGAAIVLGAGLLAAQGTDPLDGLGSGELLARSVRTVGRDLGALAMAPFDFPKETGWFLGGSLLLVSLDRPLTEGWQKQVETKVDFHVKGLWTSNVGGLGGADTWLVASLPAWYLGSLAAGSGRGQAAALLGSKAVVYSYLLSHVVLKTAFARERPNPALGLRPAEAPKIDSPWAWGRFHRPYLESRADGTAFPSFHATLYAAVASVFAEVYDSPWVPYGLALGLFCADIRGHQHWVSDMAAGAAIGISIGKTVVREFRGGVRTPRGGLAWSVQPWTDLQSSAGLALRAVW